MLTDAEIQVAEAAINVVRRKQSDMLTRSPALLQLIEHHGPALIAALREAQAELAKVREEAGVDAMAIAYQLDHLDENLRNERAHALEQAIDTVLDRQVRDTARMAGTDLDSGSCGSWCGHGKTCHHSEAYAALERVLPDLRALASAGSSVTNELATARAERDEFHDTLADVTAERDQLARQVELLGSYLQAGALDTKQITFQFSELEADRDRLAGQVESVREEIAAARLHAERLFAVADDARRKGDRVRASRLQRAGSEISEWSEKVERTLDGGEPDAG